RLVTLKVPERPRQVVLVIREWRLTVAQSLRNCVHARHTATYITLLHEPLPGMPASSRPRNSDIKRGCRSFGQRNRTQFTLNAYGVHRGLGWAERAARIEYYLTGKFGPSRYLGSRTGRQSPCPKSSICRGRTGAIAK